MIVIVEGPDGSGKSSLAKLLGDKLGCTVYKDERGKDMLDPSDMAGHDRGSVLAAVQMGGDIVFDRAFPSTAAYGEVLGREVDWTQIGMLDSEVSSVPHLAVLLTLSSCDAALSRRPDMTYDLWRDLNNAYADFVDKSMMTWVAFDGEWDLNMMLEACMFKISKQRPLSEEIYMNIARESATRATCLSRRTGAVLVSAKGHVISIGYNGVPTGVPHPVKCDRLRAGIGSGQSLDGCMCGHAEENAIVHASLNGADPAGGTLYTILSPCSRCARMIINAKVSEIVYEKLYSDEQSMEMLANSGVKVRQM